MTKEASRKISFLNLFMTLTIVLYHMKWYPSAPKNFASGFDEALNTFLYNYCDMGGFLAMSFFFTTSGFLYYANLSSEAPVKHALSKLKTRVYTLLIPYLIWNTVMLLFSDIKINSVSDILVKYTLDPACGQLWYLLAIFFFSLFSPLVAYLSRKRYLMNIFLAVMLIFIILKNSSVIPSLFTAPEIWWWYGNPFFYLPAYLIGVIIALNFGTAALNVSLPSTLPYKILSIALTITTVGLLLLGFSNFEALGVGYLLPYAYYLAPIVLWLTISNSFFTRDIPQFLNCAFFTYATHYAVGNKIVPYLTSIFNIESLSVLEAFGVRLLLVAMIYLFSIALSEFLRLVLKPRAYGALTGNRTTKRQA